MPLAPAMEPMIRLEHDRVQRLSNREEQLRERLGHLVPQATADQVPVLQADLAGDDQPVPGTHDRSVGTHGLVHGGDGSPPG